MNKEKEIEIYALSKQIDKIEIKEFDNKVRVVVDLSQVQKEQDYLEKKGLISPIREQTQFKKIQLMKEAESLRKEIEDKPENEQTIKMLEEKIEDGKRAIDYLMVTFKPCALNCAKSWMNNDRLNNREDWNQIIDMALFDAIMQYSLEAGTQFTTFLTNIMLRDCKENKCKSSLVSVNPSAAHKKRQLQKAEAEVLAKGGSIDDDYAVAKAMGRDVSTPRKLQTFREMRMDMAMIFPSGVSMESQSDEGSRTLGESIASSTLSGEQLIIAKDYEERMSTFLSTLPEEYVTVIMGIINPEIKASKIPSYDKIITRLSGNEIFKKLLKEGTRLKEQGIITNFFA